MSERLLTIGMSTFDDWDGVWMTMQSIRLYHPEVLNRIEFVVVDNNPLSKKGETIQKFVREKFDRKDLPSHYVSTGERHSTSMRNLVFHAANTEYVLCIDSHIMLPAGVLAKLIRFLDSGAARNDLFHGPLLTEAGYVIATHMNPAFRGGNFGVWGVMTPFTPTTVAGYMAAQPYEIPMHGMGLFLTRRDSWLGFHLGFNNFAGEEGYTQEKYRNAGRRVWLLPFLMWQHRFGHVGGPVYPITNYHKLRNHLIGWREVALPVELAYEYFGSMLNDQQRIEAMKSVDALDIQPQARIDKTPFLGFPIRIIDQTRAESDQYAEFERTAGT